MLEETLQATVRDIVEGRRKICRLRHPRAAAVMFVRDTLGLALSPAIEYVDRVAPYPPVAT